MMTDKEFCEEYVRRMVALERPKTKTAIEMKLIVLDGGTKSVETMFKDDAFKKLGYDAVTKFVYGFARDNQHLFAKKPKDWYWVCNECGSCELTSAVSEDDLEYMACTGCGCNEFHREDKGN